MNLNHYFDPVSINLHKRDFIESRHQLISSVSVHTSDNKIKNIENYNIAIIGVLDDNADNLVMIREYLYSLSSFNRNPKIFDLGNLKKVKTTNDLLIGLRDVIIEILALNIIPIIIGPSEYIIYSNYIAYSKLGREINLVSIDSKINISENKSEEFKSALWKIIFEESESLFSYINIGYQTHFVNTEVLRQLSDKQHFAYRLGYTRSNLKEVEPIFRDADLIGLNISSVRQSDAYGQTYSSPNGYHGEEICQLARYAGVSCKLSSFGVYDYNAILDVNYQTAHLIAQIIWYFIDGYNNRIEEYPLENENDYKKFIVNLNSIEYELVFYKSKKTERWWVEVPSFKNSKSENLLISCTYEDYVKAGNGDVPDRWLRFYQKIN